MKVEEYGKGNSKTIVMLHGAHFVHTFGRQYSLSEKYHIVVPHIMGFGDNTDLAFQTDECIAELAEYIKSLTKGLRLSDSRWAHSSLSNWSPNMRNCLNRQSSSVRG